MQFKDIVYKNIKGNIKKYLSYFNSSLFCVFMFIMYCSLALNDCFGSGSVEDSEMPLKLFFIVSVISILIFSVFFVSYANSSFMKTRSKEFGTYQVLGMDNKKLSLMVFIETSLINISSIALGMALGGLFSKLFQMAVLKLLGIDTINATIKPECFLLTFIVYIIVLFVISSISIIKLQKKDIESLMKYGRRKETSKYSILDTTLTVIGLVMLISSFILLGLFASNVSVNSTMPFIISYIGTSFIGIILLSYFGVKSLIHLLKKSKFYHNNMISISKLEYKHSSNAKMILILSILAAMIVLSIGAPLSLVSLSETIVSEGSADIEYMTYKDTTEDVSKINDSLNDIMLRDDVKDFYYVYVNEKPVIIESITNYNWDFSTDYYVNNEQVLIGITTWIPGSLGFQIGSQVCLNGSVDENLVISKAEKMNFFSGNLFPTKTIFIVSDSVYEELIVSNQVVSMHKVTVKDWKKSGDAVNRLASILKKGTHFSRYENLKILKTGYQTFFFVAASLSFMFFISTGCVTYFRMFNELDEEKKSFYKLYKIGITEKEIKKVINYELAFVYFTPLFFGGILGLSIMYYMTSIFTFDTGSSFVSIFMLRGFLAWLIYVGFQLVFFLLTKYKYQSEVIKMAK